MTNNPSENIWYKFMKMSKIGPYMESLTADFFPTFCQNYQKFCCESLARNLSLIGDISEVFSKFAKFSGAIVSEDGDKTFFLHITWSGDQWLTWHSGWDTLTLNHKGCIIRGNRTQYQKYICIRNWEKLVLQIGAALFCYKLGQTLL